MSGERKRAPESSDRTSDIMKKQKTVHDTRSLQRFGGARNFGPKVTIEPGDAGIWATCDRNKEAKCIGELRDLFQEYAEKLYPDASGAADDDENEDVDIEAEIKAEIKDMKKPKTAPLFTNIRLDVQCVIFFRTQTPIEPVSFVHAIMKDVATAGQPRTRYVKRLTPMTRMGRATEDGLADVAKDVLASHFHDTAEPKKFAIRPSLRNNGKNITRDTIIKDVARLVGPGHSVDLKNYDLLILVEVYQHICGMSVVGSDYDELKRYNLWELCQTPSREES